MYDKGELGLIIKKKYPDDVLLIFVGYADDAKKEANSICRLKQELQEDLDRINRHSSSSFTRVEIFDWKDDANLGVGGQEYAIDPYLERANIGIFVFKQRVGEVTWKELDKYRMNTDNRKPVFAIFPKDPYVGVHASQRDVSATIWNLEDKQRILTEDWAEKNSKSVTPVEPYEDIPHLKKIVKKRLEDVFDWLVPNFSSNYSSLDNRQPAFTENEENKPYIDQITGQVNYDRILVKNFREKLRPGAKLKSKNKSDAQFLIDNGYIRNGRLTIAGVLLFGNPLTHMSSSITQCVSYKGTTETADKSGYEIFDDSLLLQIEETHNFVASKIETRERPVGSKLTSETIYKYPMTCVREMIANALCHREYKDPSRNTFVRIYTNCIKVLSPGSWFKEELPKNRKIFISELVGESVPRNMSLARAFASIKIVEKEGSGLKSAIRDCKLANAPEPIVEEKDGYVVVTIFPRENWDNLNVRQVYRDTLKRSRENGSKKLFISYSHKDKRWKDRLVKHLKVLEMDGMIELWDDSWLKPGDDWYPEIEKAINDAEAAILLISVDYLVSQFILNEEVPALLQRTAKEKMKIFPILIKPCPWKEIAWLNSIQVFPKEGKALSELNPNTVEKSLSDISLEIYNILIGKK
jgi:hypothetical protein